MPGALDMAVIIQQLPSVQKLTHAEQAKPEAFQSLLGSAVAKDQTQDKTKVQQVAKKERSDIVQRDGKKEREQQQAFQHNHEKRSPEDEEETSGANSSPWAGNFINLKI